MVTAIIIMVPLRRLYINVLLQMDQYFLGELVTVVHQILPKKDNEFPIYSSEFLQIWFSVDYFL